MKNLLYLLPLILLTGCNESPTERTAMTQASANAPETVCKMLDGRVLYRITIDMPDHDHYVYFFGTNDTSTTSVNYSVQAGKVTYNQTIVIDGKNYELVPK